MEPGITCYEVLGVVPGTAADKIRRWYEERAALLRAELIAAAPSDVLVSVRRAQEFLDGAWEVLGGASWIPRRAWWWPAAVPWSP